MDPVELRHRNLLKPGEEFATGEIMSEAVYDELLDMAAEAVDWPNDARVDLGEDIVRAKGVAVILKSTITPSTSHAAVRLDNDGSVHVLTSSVEMGQGAHTVLAQIAAQELEVDIEQVSVSAPDTAYTPYDQTTSSSRTTRAMGGAVSKAASEVRERLLERAADMFDVTADKLLLNEGKVEIRDVLDSGISIPDVLAESRTGSILGQGEVITAGGLDAETGQGLASDHWHQGSASVELDVDLATGKVYLRSLYAAALAGRVINPKLARLQMHGSMIFGIGHALYEELIFEDGQLTNPNLSDYAITAMGDLPKLEIGLLEESGAATIHGLGETTLPHPRAGHRSTGGAVSRTEEVKDVTCRINGEEVTLSGEAAGSTVAALRARGLYGVRETCGLGVCGTCTVLLDGEPVSTCILPKFALEGRDVVTVEGAATDGELSELQKQFIESQAFQCSFCTPGFLASAQALLDRTSSELTRDEVEEGLQGHLCRCGSYDAINDAIIAVSRRRGASDPDAGVA